MATVEKRIKHRVKSLTATFNPQKETKKKLYSS